MNFVNKKALKEFPLSNVLLLNQMCLALVVLPSIKVLYPLSAHHKSLPFDTLTPASKLVKAERYEGEGGEYRWGMCSQAWNLYACIRTASDLAVRQLPQSFQAARDTAWTKHGFGCIS